MLISVAMASQRSGSKVLICTDGLANIGMGKMQEVDDDIYQMSMGFFEDVGCYARDAGYKMLDSFICNVASYRVLLDTA